MNQNISKILTRFSFSLFIILVLIVFIAFRIISNNNKVEQALNTSIQNREQVIQAKEVTELTIKTENLFYEYCITFDSLVFENYKRHVKELAEHIYQLKSNTNEKQTNKQQDIDKILKEKEEESSRFIGLKQAADSLIFSANLLDNKQKEIVQLLINSSTSRQIDTLSVTKTQTRSQKGLFGAIKKALVGEKIEDSINTQLQIKYSNENELIPPLLVEDVLSNKVPEILYNSVELAKKSSELKKSGIKLIQINNQLIAKIHKLGNEINTDIKKREASSFQNYQDSVSKSTRFSQRILVLLIVIGVILAFYTLLLARKNNKYQTQIIELNEKVTKDSKEKDKLFSIIGHDLMNPFNALIGFSEVLVEVAATGKKEEIIEYSSIINDSSHRILSLLKNLLVWARVQTGTVIFSPTQTEVKTLVSESVMIVKAVAQNKEILINWNVKDNISIRVDLNMISSILQNLITNAIKFTTKGGSVSIESFVESGKLFFVISDTGVGMKQEQIDNLFRIGAAKSQKGTDNEEGTGLGLILTMEFIEKHRGKIWAESELGKGSRFTFYLPI